MTNESKHTATPWILGGKDGDGKGADGHIYCDNAYGSAVAICYGKHFDFSALPESELKANAAHIVKCVNAHDDLVSALESIAASPYADSGSRKKAIAALKKGSE